MSSSTLTSLAMLKVHVDQGHDYLDYLRPFILQVLVDHQPNPVTDIGVRDFIRSDFGMEIPTKAVQLVLKRLSKVYPLKKKHGVYQLAGEIPDPRINAQKSNAERHINAVLAGLQQFSKTTAKPIATEEEADVAIQAFLSQFDVQCLKAYLRGTAIPNIDGHHNAHIVLVSKYVLALQKSDPERFGSFLVVVQGHMLANALLCPDIQSAPKSYHGVTFYLDTPLLVRLLGLEGTIKADSIRDLVDLLILLGGTVAAFEHSRDELESVIKGAAHHIDSPDGHGPIVIEARRNRTTKSDLILLSGQIEKQIEEAKVAIKATPKYVAEFQIDEMDFSGLLEEDISYANPYARDYDVNSVRSIYVLRENITPQNVEKCKAVLVTCNAAFARAAFQYGLGHKQSREVSTVITDFSLANLAWLKAPMGAPSIPMREVLAFSYAALQPSRPIWDKYLAELEKLERLGTITARDLQLLRSAPLAQDELMNLTLGEEESLSEQTITDVLSRVTDEIKREESDKLSAEKTAHTKTQEQLSAERSEKLRIQQRLYWRCNRKAGLCAWTVSIAIVTALVVGLAASLGVRSENPIWNMALPLTLVLLFVLTLGNLVWGSTIRTFHQSIHDRCRAWFLTRESAALGIDILGIEK
ncbi:MAG: hypothetical protein ACYDCF_09520 [Burkholderiales bacterium]